MEQISKSIQARKLAIAGNIYQQFEKGVYADTWENRKLGRVGLLYGDDLTEQLKNHTSQRRHLDPETGYYHTNRFNLHKEIVNKIAAGGTTSQHPTVVLLLGGSGSGKSYVYKNMVKPELEQGTEKFAYLNVDDIKEELPDYKRYIEQDPKSAAHRVHDESADIGRMAYRRLIKDKRNFIYDATLSNSWSAVSKIEELKRAGYNVRLVGVVAHPDVVKKAVLDRGKATGRYVPLDIVLNRQQGARETFKYLASKQTHKLNHISLYNNDGLLQGKQPVKVYENGTVLHQEKFAAL